MNIYVGNLSFRATEEDLQQAFSAFGQVTSVSIIKDQFTGKSRGFGFVEMANAAEGQAAITGLNGKELQDRALTVNEARPREAGGPRTGGPRRDSGNRGGGFGGGNNRRGW